MPTLIALIIASTVAYLPHALFGDRLSPFADAMASLVVGSVSYVVALWYLKRLKGGL